MKIIVAEDEPVSRKMLGRSLEKLGYQVVSCENGQEAWRVYRRGDARFIVSDLEMPRMDGITLCRRIREGGAPGYCYFILLTAKSDAENLQEAFAAGADDYISKPFNNDELFMRVKTGERILNLEEGHARLARVLTESRNKLKSVFDSLSEEILVLDRAFNTVTVNKLFVRNRNLVFRELVGQPARHADGRLLSPETVARINDVLADGRPRRFFYEQREENGRVFEKDVQCIPVADEEGGVFQVALVIRDVTEERKSAVQIRRLNDKLRAAVTQIRSKNEKLEDALHRLRDSQAHILQSEKMASIGQLAAGVAHEINNPTGFVSSNLKTLTGYVGNMLELLFSYRELASLVEGRRNAVEDEARRLSAIRKVEKEIDLEFLQEDILDLIRESREGMDRIKKIVMDLKDFAHPEDEEKKFADLNACIDSTLNIVWNEIKYKADLKKHYDDIPPLFCFPRQLNQVIMNLLVNASQAIEDHGTIDVSTRYENGNIQLVVKDNGAGIPAKHLTKIFDPFFTTKPVGKGTGLGLHLVYSIVKKHGGSIQVRSEVGKGTEFQITLPAETASVEEMTAPVATPARGPGGGE